MTICRREPAVACVLVCCFGAATLFAWSSSAHDGLALAEVPCRALGAMQIFSHHGLSGEGNARPESAIPTEASLLQLHRQGVSNFDMDLFYSDDQTQFVAHPDALSKALRVQSVFNLSDKQLAREVIDKYMESGYSWLFDEQARALWSLLCSHLC